MGNPGNPDRGTCRLGTDHMVSIGTGQDANPGDKLPIQAQITTALGTSEATARRASRELARLGLIRLVPGHGYYPGTWP